MVSQVLLRGCSVKHSWRKGSDRKWQMESSLEWPLTHFCLPNICMLTLIASNYSALQKTACVHCKLQYSRQKTLCPRGEDATWGKTRTLEVLNLFWFSNVPNRSLPDYRTQLPFFHNWFDNINLICLLLKGSLQAEMWTNRRCQIATKNWGNIFYETAINNAPEKEPLGECNYSCKESVLFERCFRCLVLDRGALCDQTIDQTNLSRITFGQICLTSVRIDGLTKHSTN